MRLSSWRVWALALAGAAVLTILTTAQSYASRRLEQVSASWERILRIQAIDWFAWALLLPGILTLAAAVSWHQGSRAGAAARWTGAGLVAAGLHAAIEVAAARTLGAVPTGMPVPTMLMARLTETLAASLIVFAVIVFGYYAARHYGEATAKEQRAAALEARLSEARLEALRSQLQPHFLFNTLHTVSALLPEDVAGARRMLTRLGDLLRSSLATQGRHEVPLRQELAMLDQYLDIQRTRFGERLQVSIDADPDALAAQVPAMILQPIVENAIRYGVEQRPTGGAVSVGARRADASLLLEVTDDGPGAPSAMAGSGIGLANTRDRLRQLYGTDHELRLENSFAGGSRVVIRLPYRETS